MGDKPLTQAERTKRASLAKQKAGELRVSTWIPTPGSKALVELRKGGQTDREIMNDALVILLEAQKKSP